MFNTLGERLAVYEGGYGQLGPCEIAKKIILTGVPVCVNCPFFFEYFYDDELHPGCTRAPIAQYRDIL